MTSKKFNWRKYSYDNNLSPYVNRADALEHKLLLLIKEAESLELLTKEIKVEPYSLNMNYNKNIAMFCHTIPTPDKDSGSNRLNKIIKLLVQLKYKIYYFTHDTQDQNIRYKKELEQLCVRVIPIDKIKEVYCSGMFSDIVNKEKINFDIAMFCFYDMYQLYASDIKKIFPTIKTIVDSVDVHWVRLERGNRLNIEDKEKEKQSYKYADVVFAVTDNDKNEILKECKDANVKILSNIHSMKNTNPKYEKNIIFIGGSNHTPNVEAALKSIDIFNQFIQNNEAYKKSKLFIVGQVFADSIIQLASLNKNIKILTSVDSAQLKSLYENNVACALCPITWGAGIKGKVCEAIEHKIPVITSHLGNEGIDLVHNYSGFICSNIDEYVASIKKIFASDKKIIKSLVNNAQNKLKLLVSEESALDVIEGTLTCKHIVLSIATYKNALILERCINSIMQNTLYPNFTIHIVSNGCNDNTENVLEKMQKMYGQTKIQYSINKTNEHFIKAHNKVISIHPNSDIILINNDMEFIDPLWLHHLYSSAYSAGYIGCAGGKTLNYEFKISESGACIFNDGDGMNFGRDRDRNDVFMNTVRHVGYVSGCLMYMKRNIINKFGKLDDSFYPCYYEDSDWQYNIHLHGYKTIINPRCEVLHREGTSSNVFDQSNNFKEQCMKKNKIKFLEKYKSVNLENFNT